MYKIYINTQTSRFMQACICLIFIVDHLRPVTFGILGSSMIFVRFAVQNNVRGRSNMYNALYVGK